MKTKAIIIGVGAPNRCKNGDSTQCAIALSEEFGLFRIYPLRVGSVKTWSEVSIEAGQNPKDSRVESWKLHDVRTTGRVIDDRGERAAILDDCVLVSGHEDPIKYQNDNRASVAVIRPEIESAFISRGEFDEPPDQVESEDAWIYCQKESPYKPYIYWRSHTGKEHTSHIVAHEAYEWLRKEPTRPHCLFDNMALMNPDYIYWFVIGNMKDRRNVWVIVHVHRMKKPINYFIAHSYAGRSGGNAAWPYSRQEAENVKRAEDRQMSLMFTTDGISRDGNRGNTTIAI